MVPDQTAPIGAARPGSKLFVGKASKIFRQTIKQTIFVVIGAFRAKSTSNFQAS